jgi:hypothetical protein
MRVPPSPLYAGVSSRQHLDNLCSHFPAAQHLLFIREFFTQVRRCLIKDPCMAALLSVPLFVCLSDYLSVSMQVCFLFAYLSVCLPVSLPICFLSAYLSV